MRKHLLAAFLALAVAAAVPPGALAYEAGTVKDGGAIKGKVVFKGQSVPTRTVLPTKDKEVCGDIRKEPLVEVGKGGGVRNAVAIIKEIARGKAWGKPAEAPRLDNDKCVFVPHVQVMQVGSEIAIHNSDPMLHNTHGFYGKKTAFNVALPFPGAEVKRKLDKPGVVRVDCDVHGWMQGWIFVADNPYYALTGEDGSFTIGDVPAGDYTILIWQEHAGEMERQVSVKAGETTDIGTVEIK
ncbi:MAG: hypothetical protein Kow0025_13840 [Thermodesulfovibrionales bacterium]